MCTRSEINQLYCHIDDYFNNNEMLLKNIFKMLKHQLCI